MKKESPPLTSSPAENHDNLSRAEELALKLLEERRKKAAINMEDFVSVPQYGEERVRHDQKRVEIKKSKIEATGMAPGPRGRLLEGLMIDQIELGNWFGENTFTVASSEYDDYYHGVDLVAGTRENEETTKHMALGIDVTSSTMRIRKKLGIIKREIGNGKLTTVEYFHSEDYKPDYYGSLENIPYVVVGAGDKTINEISELWMSAYGLKRMRGHEDESLTPEAREGIRKRAKAASQKLANHRIQFLLLEEIKMQLIAFIKFAEKKNRKQIAEQLDSTLESVNSILAGKKSITLEEEDKLNNASDPVFQSLKDAVDDFENLPLISD